MRYILSAQTSSDEEGGSDSSRSTMKIAEPQKKRGRGRPRKKVIDLFSIYFITTKA